MSTWDPPPNRDWPEPERGRNEHSPDELPDWEGSPRPPQSRLPQGQPGNDALGRYEWQAGSDPLSGYPPAPEYPAGSGYQPAPEYPAGSGYQPAPGYPAGPGYPPAPDYPPPPAYPRPPAYPPPPGEPVLPGYQDQMYEPQGYDTGRFEQQYPAPYQRVEPEVYGRGLFAPADSYSGYDPPGDSVTGDETRFMPAPLEPTPLEPAPLERAPREPAVRDPAPLEPAPFEPQPEPDDVTPPPPSPGRAGRNLPAAIAVGVGLAALVLVSLYLYRVVFVGVAVVAIVLAVWELSNALASRQIHPPVVPLVVGSVAMLVGAYAGGAEALAVATALTVLGVMMWRLPEGAEGYLQDMTAGVFAALYVPFLAGFAILMLLPEDGDGRVTVFILVTVCSDIGGYAAGVLFGRHPMAPAISPKKSWEGFAGSAVACTVGGALSMQMILGGSWWQGVILGAATVLTATLGDLGESMIKRDLGIKDMGSLLPGHGGLMDRLDSLLPTAPIVWLLLSVFVPAT